MPVARGLKHARIVQLVRGARINPHVFVTAKWLMSAPTSLIESIDNGVSPSFVSVTVLG